MFERTADAPRQDYEVAVFLPAGRRLDGRLQFTEAGESIMELGDDADASEPDATLEWVRAEILKLARVLRRNPKTRLVRWRGGE